MEQSQFSGYKIVFIHFKDAMPNDKPEDFLIGFIDDAKKSRVHGRPVDITVITDGSLLVADDASNVICRLAP
jgi:glucose/arabinose dehydrogenase